MDDNAQSSGERTRPRVLVSAPRRNLFNACNERISCKTKVREREGAIASTRGACAPRIVANLPFCNITLFSSALQNSKERARAQLFEG
jgi:hypothetical protein